MNWCLHENSFSTNSFQEGEESGTVKMKPVRRVIDSRTLKKTIILTCYLCRRASKRGSFSGGRDSKRNLSRRDRRRDCWGGGILENAPVRPGGERWVFP